MKGVETRTCNRDHNHTETREIPALPYEYKTVDGVKVYSETLVAGQAKDLSGLVEEAKAQNGKVALTVGNLSLTFDVNAVNALGGETVSLKITIQEIVDNCGYSPATFYRNFKDKYDLIAWEHTRAVSEIVDRVGEGNYLWKQTLYDGARMYYENKDYLANLLKHTSGHDSFMRYMAEINCAALKKYILSVNGNRELTHEEMMCVKIYCLGLVGLACEWIMGQVDTTVEEIARIYEGSIPSPLVKYLL